MDNQEPRVKRPYHKSADRWNIGKPQEPVEQTVEAPVSEPIVNKPPEIKVARELTYEDLPESTRIGVEKSIAFRRNLNLEDDSEVRKQNAVNYRKFELERNK